MSRLALTRSALSAAVLSSLVLTACGGGGGGAVKSDAPAAAAVTAPRPRYGGIQDNVRIPANLDLAQARGFDGSGVKVGLMDEARLDYRPLDGQVSGYQDVLLDPASALHPSDARNGHGTVVAAIIAGLPVDGFAGGGAPGADLYWARVCADGTCSSEMSRVAAKWLAQQGTRIVNLSFGAGGASEDERRQAARWWAYALAPLLDTDALVVAAAGNARDADAQYPAATPQYAPETAGQFLAVAAVDIDSHGQAIGLAAYSNLCGAAAQWCLVAPGSVQAANAPGTAPLVSGTSVAAPIVTATAALVAQAFPWMSARNLQQTVLSTATDLGAPGVDALYGWGLVNAAKAVDGPAWFGSDFVADVRGESVFGNDIGGSGGLIKQGDGSLVLRGKGTYTGLTDVRSGTLGMQGDVSGSVSVRQGATLQAMGGRVGGDYRADAGATTSIAPGAPLAIGGNASLDGTLLLRPAASGYVVSSSETLLTAAHVDGRFAEIALANGFFYTPTLSYEDSRVVAALSRSAAAPAALSASLPAVIVDGARQADALIQALDAQANPDTPPPSPILASATALMAADEGQVQASLASFAGALHGSVRAAGLLANTRVQNVLADRLPGLLANAAPGLWLQVDHGDGALRRAGYARTDYRDDGTTLGADLPLAHGLIGASLSAARQQVDTDNDRGQVQRDGISVYAGTTFDAFYVSGEVNASRARVDGQRTLQVAATAQTVISQHRDQAESARLELGLRADSGFTPFVAGGMIRQHQGAFSEASASGMGLDADADSVQLHYLEIGQRADLRYGHWTFDGVLACRRNSGDALDFNAAFAGLPDTRFVVTGAPLPRDVCRGAANADVALGLRGGVRIGLGLERGSDQADQQQANLAFYWRL